MPCAKFHVTFASTESMRANFESSAPMEADFDTNLGPQWADTRGDTGTAADVLDGVIVHSNLNGVAVRIVGTMPNNGELYLPFDGLTAMSVDIPAGHTSGGVALLTDDIAELLAAY